MEFIVAVDGPAGSGKSTIAKLIAKELKFLYIDTGAMYRMAALFYMNHNIDIENIDSVVENLEKIKIDMEEDKFYLCDVDVTEEIRSREVSQNVSKIAAVKKIREKMVEIQRKIAANKKTILDGRDIGTVVFPNANLKIFLEASPEERAKRRLLEYQAKKISVSYKEVLMEIMTRDKQDMERDESPLTKAGDAFLIDSTKYSINEVKKMIIEMIDKEMIRKTIG